MGQTKPKKSAAIGVRLGPADAALLDQVHEKTQMSKSDIARRALQYAIPLFLSGRVSIADLSEQLEPASL